MTKAFKVLIALEDDAMQTPEDVGRALTLVVDQLKNGQVLGVIRDDNGNTVGTWGGDFSAEAQ